MSSTLAGEETEHDFAEAAAGSTAPEPLTGFVSPPPLQRRADRGPSDGVEPNGDDGAASPPGNNPGDALGQQPPSEAELALDQLTSISRSGAHPGAKKYWSEAKKLRAAASPVVRPEWYRDVCDEYNWPESARKALNDPMWRGGASPHFIHLTAHTCLHANCNAAKRCRHAKDCPCKFGKPGLNPEECVDAPMLKLHATVSSKNVTLTVGMADSSAGWCSTFRGDGTDVNARCDGVPMGTSVADLQETAVFEIARAQLGVLQDTIAQRAASRKLSQRGRAIDRTSVGGSGGAAGGLGSAGGLGGGGGLGSGGGLGGGLGGASGLGGGLGGAAGLGAAGGLGGDRPVGAGGNARRRARGDGDEGSSGSDNDDSDGDGRGGGLDDDDDGLTLAQRVAMLAGDGDGGFGGGRGRGRGRGRRSKRGRRGGIDGDGTDGLFADGMEPEVEERAKRKVQGKSSIWENGHCVAELEAARGAMAYCGFTFRISNAALEKPSERTGQSLTTHVISDNCRIETHISSLPGINAKFCSVADHDAALAADAALASPKLRDLCGPNCRFLVASLLKAQLCGSITHAQFHAIDRACS